MQDTDGTVEQRNRCFSSNHFSYAIATKIPHFLAQGFALDRNHSNFWHVKLALSISFTNVEMIVGLNSMRWHPALRHPHDEDTSAAMEHHRICVNAGQTRLYPVKHHILKAQTLVIWIGSLSNNSLCDALSIFLNAEYQIATCEIGEGADIGQKFVPSSIVTAREVALEVDGSAFRHPGIDQTSKILFTNFINFDWNHSFALLNASAVFPRPPFNFTHGPTVASSIPFIFPSYPST